MGCERLGLCLLGHHLYVNSTCPQLHYLEQSLAHHVLARKEITKDGPEYKEFQERAGLPESDFSLAQLFIYTSCKSMKPVWFAVNTNRCSATTKWDEELSDFGDKEQDFKDLSADAHATFTTFIQQWLNLMKEKGCNILGYSAQREADNECKTRSTYSSTAELRY